MLRQTKTQRCRTPTEAYFILDRRKPTNIFQCEGKNCDLQIQYILNLSWNDVLSSEKKIILLLCHWAKVHQGGGDWPEKRERI